jgi:O-antigen ligase
MTPDHAFIVASEAMLGLAAATAAVWMSVVRPRLLLYVTLALAPTQFLFVPIASFFLSPADGLVIGSLAGMFWRLARGKRSGWEALWQHRWLAMMIFAYIIGFVVLGVFSRTIVRPALAIIPSILTCELLRSRTHLARAAMAVAAAGIIDAAFGLLTLGHGGLSGRFGGLGGPNFSAIAITSAAVITCATVARTTQPARLAVPGTLTGLSLATLSQTGVASLLGAWFAVLHWVVSRENKRWLLIGATALAALALSQSAIRDRLVERNQRGVQNDGMSRNSADVRLLVLRMIGRGVSESPLFGVGYAQFQPFSSNDPEIYASTGGTGYGTHNTYLEVLVEGGLFALVPFLLHFAQYGRGLRFAWHAMVKQHDVVVAAAFAALPVVAISAALTNVLLFYSFWAICGLALACVNVLVAENRREGVVPLRAVGATA